MKVDEDSICKLADAIVIQACQDYRSAIRGKCKNPNVMIHDIMSFFESEWYKQLTDIDYQYLVDKMNDEW